MNALRHAKQAYSAAKAPTRTLKNLEYDAIARITHRLVAASKKGPDEFKALAAALTDNRRLWSIFMADISSPSNQLPLELNCPPWKVLLLVPGEKEPRVAKTPGVLLVLCSLCSRSLLVRFCY